MIDVENQWAENFRTVDGMLMHEHAHAESTTEKRGDLIITRGMRVFSRSMGVSGQCDVLEFHRDPSGVRIRDWEGLYRPFPVEYKRGEPKKDNCDAAQLCAQAMCLEEMLCVSIENGALFYGETKRRLPVIFTQALRELVRSSFVGMHELFKKGHTPSVKPTKACKACSLVDICLPSLQKSGSVEAYLSGAEEALP